LKFLYATMLKYVSITLTTVDLILKDLSAIAVSVLIKVFI